MDDEFSFPAADLYRPVYDHAPPSDPSKSILSLPTEVIVNIAQLNFKTGVALMCTNRVLHAAGVTALYAKVFLRGRKFHVPNPDTPDLVVPGVLGGLLAKQEHTAALRYIKILSMPYDTDYWTAFITLVCRVFERAHGLVSVDIQAMYELQRLPSPQNTLLQPAYPQNLHTLYLHRPTDHFAPHLLIAPSLKEVKFSDSYWRWDTLLANNQEPYSQVTSLSHIIYQGDDSDAMIGDISKMSELFTPVERLEVKNDQLSEFLDCVPQTGDSWAKIKHLCLVYAWHGSDVGQPHIDESTKSLLVRALSRLCLALDTANMPWAKEYAIWLVI